MMIQERLKGEIFQLSQITRWRKSPGHSTRRNPGRIQNIPWIHLKEFLKKEVLKKPRQPTLTGKGDGEERYPQNNDCIDVLSSIQVFNWLLHMRKLLETRGFSLDIMGTTITKFWGYHSSLNFFQRPVLLLIYSSG